ncbi:hypothetical protein [Rhodoligotrophos ferricapiens]|uniref:hypothetical protein n=1 Tax=Rhodoligotrophos ferricapiens TaxID=3069264 RepID=UPI00315D6AE7
MQSTDRQRLLRLVADRLQRQVPAPIEGLAEAARARHSPGVVAVLAYGSCLRGIDPRETLADLYVLTETTAAVSRNPLSRLGCRLLPPNVYYLEADMGAERFRAKYAVMPIDLFEAWVAPSTDNPYFWARFAQPSALVWIRDDITRQRVITAIAQAVATMLGEARRLAGGNQSQDPLKLWQAVLRETYQTELRSESVDRGNSIVAADADWYRATAGALPAHGTDRDRSPGSIARSWAHRRRRGKVLAALRLIKAAFTFQGGADYLAWKIERHSKVKVELTDWQRRHPLIAAITLMPRLYKRGGFR